VQYKAELAAEIARLEAARAAAREAMAREAAAPGPARNSDVPALQAAPGPAISKVPQDAGGSVACSGPQPGASAATPEPRPTSSPASTVTLGGVQNALRAAVNKGMIGIGSSCLLVPAAAESPALRRISELPNLMVDISRVEDLTRFVIQPKRSQDGVPESTTSKLSPVMAAALLELAAPEDACGFGIDVSSLAENRGESTGWDPKLTTAELQALEQTADVQIANAGSIVLVSGKAVRVFAAWCALAVIPVAAVECRKASGAKPGATDGDLHNGEDHGGQQQKKRARAESGRPTSEGAQPVSPSPQPPTGHSEPNAMGTAAGSSGH